ncbi:MAG: DUF4082 domain-containing protein [Polyangiaceae bacterium]
MRPLALVFVACLVGCQLVTGPYSVGDAGSESGGGSSGGSSGGGSGGSSSGGTEACTAVGAVDLTPTTGSIQQATLFSGTVGYLVTFSCTTTITGIEFTGAPGSTGAVSHVWDANGNVLATGSTVYQNSGVQWYRSNVSFSASAGEPYVVGVHADQGFLGDVFNNIALPFTAGHATVQQSCTGACTGCGGDAGAQPDVAPTCSVSGRGYEIRIDTQ